MEHLQQKPGNPAHHHGSDITVDAPCDRSFRQESVGASCDGCFALRRVVEYSRDLMADRRLHGVGQRDWGKHERANEPSALLVRKDVPSAVFWPRGARLTRSQDEPHFQKFEAIGDAGALPPVPCFLQARPPHITSPELTLIRTPCCRTAMAQSCCPYNSWRKSLRKTAGRHLCCTIRGLLRRLANPSASNRRYLAMARNGNAAQLFCAWKSLLL